jgi:hypothetical protein
LTDAAIETVRDEFVRVETARGRMFLSWLTARRRVRTKARAGKRGLLIDTTSGC